MSKDIISAIKRDHINNLADMARRIDDRKFDEYRPITIELGPIDTAEGSARVKLGDTDVMVGVKAGIGEPYPDSPNEGVLTTNAELIPMASPHFDTGPPRQEAVEISRVVDRGIRESNAISLEKLCVKPKEKVWVVFIDMHVLDYDGNLFDAGTLGAISALTNTILPWSKYDEGEDAKLEVKHFPIACTIAKLGDKLAVDPGADEEKVCNTRLTVTTDENGDIRAMQKGNGGNLSIDELKKAVIQAKEANERTREKFDFLNSKASLTRL